MEIQPYAISLRAWAELLKYNKKDNFQWSNQRSGNN